MDPALGRFIQIRAHLPWGPANLAHNERPCFCIKQEKSWSFGHPNRGHVENKSYPKITKLEQKGSFINLYHLCNTIGYKLTEACAVFSVSEICWFARAYVGSHSFVTVGIDVTIMWPISTLVNICKAKNKKRNGWLVDEDFPRWSEGIKRVDCIRKFSEDHQM